MLRRTKSLHDIKPELQSPTLSQFTIEPVLLSYSLSMENLSLAKFNDCWSNTMFPNMKNKVFESIEGNYNEKKFIYDISVINNVIFNEPNYTVKHVNDIKLINTPHAYHINHDFYYLHIFDEMISLKQLTLSDCKVSFRNLSLNMFIQIRDHAEVTFENCRIVGTMNIENDIKTCLPNAIEIMDESKAKFTGCIIQCLNLCRETENAKFEIKEFIKVHLNSEVELISCNISQYSPCGNIILCTDRSKCKIQCCRIKYFTNKIINKIPSYIRCTTQSSLIVADTEFIDFNYGALITVDIGSNARIINVKANIVNRFINVSNGSIVECNNCTIERSIGTTLLIMSKSMFYATNLNINECNSSAMSLTNSICQIKDSNIKHIGTSSNVFIISGFLANVIFFNTNITSLHASCISVKISAQVVFNGGILKSNECYVLNIINHSFIDIINTNIECLYTNYAYLGNESHMLLHCDPNLNNNVILNENSHLHYKSFDTNIIDIPNIQLTSKTFQDPNSLFYNTSFVESWYIAKCSINPINPEHFIKDTVTHIKCICCNEFVEVKNILMSNSCGHCICSLCAETFNYEPFPRCYKCNCFLTKFIKIMHDDKCIICYDNKVNAVLSCGHCCCYCCAQKNLITRTSCPLCQQRVTHFNVLS